MMKKTEKMLFDAVKKQNDELACSTIDRLTSSDKELNPNAEIPNLNVCDEDGFSLLHYAIEGELLAAAVRLLEKGAKVDTKNRMGYTPLLFALNKKLETRQTNSQFIHLTAHTTTFKIIEKLVQYNADIFLKEPDSSGIGGNALHIAVRRNEPIILKTLLVKQADPTKCLEVTDRTGRTPFHIACAIGDVDMVGFMLNELKANPNFQSPQPHPMFQGSSFARLEGYTPLHYAAENNQSLIVPLLIQAGANYSIGTHEDAGMTPLVMAQRMKKIKAADAIEREVNKATSLPPKATEAQTLDSSVLTKSFIRSPIHTAQPAEVKTQNFPKAPVILTLGHIKIKLVAVLEDLGHLEVVNTEKAKPSAVIIYDKKYIEIIHKHLEENNLSELIDYFKAVETKSGKLIGLYLQEETAFLQTMRATIN